MHTPWHWQIGARERERKNRRTRRRSNSGSGLGVMQSREEKGRKPTVTDANFVKCERK